MITVGRLWDYYGMPTGVLYNSYRSGRHPTSRSARRSSRLVDNGLCMATVVGSDDDADYDDNGDDELYGVSVICDHNFCLDLAVAESLRHPLIC